MPITSNVPTTPSTAPDPRLDGDAVATRSPVTPAVVRAVGPYGTSVTGDANSVLGEEGRAGDTGPGIESPWTVASNAPDDDPSNAARTAILRSPAFLCRAPGSRRVARAISRHTGSRTSGRSDFSPPTTSSPVAARAHHGFSSSGVRYSVSISVRITPSAKTSVAGPTAFTSPKPCSGAMYIGVPIITPVRVAVRAPSCAMPKSSSLMRTSPRLPKSIITFSGLRSRCTMGPGVSTSCAASTPAHI